MTSVHIGILAIQQKIGAGYKIDGFFVVVF